MQSSEFTQTRHELGRASAYMVSRKAKGKMSGFCKSGCGWVSLTDSGDCPVCGGIILKKIRYAELIKSFEHILQRYGNEFAMLSIDARSHMTMALPVGEMTYFIPVQAFLEFERIHAGNDSRHRMFFQNIMSSCMSKKHRILISD